MFLLVGAGTHLFDEKEHDALDDEQHEEDDEDLGELGLKEGDDIVVPVAFDGLEDAFVLRDGGLEEHDNCVSLSEEDARTECVR
jgi:hypothetical protein